MRIKEVKVLPRARGGSGGLAQAQVRFRPETPADVHFVPGKPRCGGFRRDFLPQLMKLLGLDEDLVQLVPDCELAAKRRLGETCESSQICPCPAAFVDRAERLENDVEVIYTDGTVATMQVRSPRR